MNEGVSAEGGEEETVAGGGGRVGGERHEYCVAWGEEFLGGVRFDNRRVDVDRR